MENIVYLMGYDLTKRCDDGKVRMFVPVRKVNFNSIRNIEAGMDCEERPCLDLFSDGNDSKIPDCQVYGIFHTKEQVETYANKRLNDSDFMKAFHMIYGKVPCEINIIYFNNERI